MRVTQVAPHLGDLREILAGLPGDGDSARRASERVADWRALLKTATEHGVAGVVLAWLRSAGVSAASAAVEEGERQQRFEVLRQDVARETLRDVMGALERSGVPAVALKGPLLAARIYEPDVVRPSTDLDVLIDGRQAIEAAGSALRPLGYRLETGPSGRFFHEHHHHVHALHPMLPTIELHYDAYRGFGTVLPAAPLLARSVPCGLVEWGSARVLSPEDEFLYLAVHGASHRFERFGWLFDLKLFVHHHQDLRWDLLFERASQHRLTAVLSFTCELLVEWLETEVPAAVDPLRLGRARTLAAGSLLAPQKAHLTNAAAAFLFSAVLCDDPARLAEFVSRFARIKMLHEMPMRVRSLFAS